MAKTETALANYRVLAEYHPRGKKPVIAWMYWDKSRFRSYGVFSGSIDPEKLTVVFNPLNDPEAIAVIEKAKKEAEDPNSPHVFQPLRQDMAVMGDAQCALCGNRPRATVHMDADKAALPAVKCPTCLGTGDLPGGYNKTFHICHVCGGSGKIR